MNRNSKTSAYAYLQHLETTLNQSLPAFGPMNAKITQLNSAARLDDSLKHLRWTEQTFVNAFALPIVFETAKENANMTTEEAQQSLLCESYRGMPNYSRATPARRLRHPFSKAINSKPDQVFEKWIGNDGSPLTQSCPDFALTNPFPHKIVFEAKYFKGQSESSARRSLVEDSYQAFFYRALPTDKTETNEPNWDYDYSCLFAYDSSNEGVLLKQWESLSSDTKAGFWEGANVYIMILRGSA